MVITQQVGISSVRRDVVATGSVLLADGDTEVVVRLDDLTYTFSFLIFPGPPSLSRTNPDALSMRFVVGGRADVPVQWDFSDVGRLNGRRLQLAFVVAQFSANSDKPVGTHLTYTFSSPPAWQQGQLP